MYHADESASPASEHRALRLLVVAISLALGWVLVPFYGTLLWGASLALLFAPLHRYFLKRLRHRRTLAALMTLLVILIIIIVPLGLLSVTLFREVAGFLAFIESREANSEPTLRAAFNALPDWIAQLLRHFGLVDFERVQRWLNLKLEQGGGFIATQAMSLGQNTFELVASLLITMYLAFFLIRDGDRIVHVMRRALPLTPSQKQELINKLSAVVRSTVRGNLVVALVQGTLGGVAFWFLEVRAALLWTVVMALLSLLPAIGAALVWLPVAIWFFITGGVWQSIALTVWGMLVIGLVDNLLRPMLVGKATLLPDYVVMISTLGGVVVFGINGFILGPLIAAMFFAVWNLHLTTHQVPKKLTKPPDQ
jgi:predicted PurR-regulated permease PerM